MPQPKIEIRMLGGFSVCIDGRPALQGMAQSRKLQQVLQYLLLNRARAVPHAELAAQFWGNASNAEASLRAVMHRLRRLAALEGGALDSWLETTRGCYRWNPALACFVDVYELERLAAQAAAAPEGVARDGMEQAIVLLYRGRLLPDSAGETWVERRQIELYAQYKAALYHQIERCKHRGDPAALAALCRRGLQQDAADERLYLEGALALQAQGRMQEAEELARTGEQAGCLHVGAHTPGALAAAYSRLCAAQTGMQNDLDRIEQRILEDDGGGAYLCSYDTFCAISRVRMRAAARSDTPLLLVTASLLPPVPRPAAGRTAAVMQVMEDVLLCTLRSSDVAARYSENRFVLLLEAPACEGASPMERVRAEFYRRPAHDGYLLAYSLRAPHPGPERPHKKRDDMKNGGR